MRWYLLGAVLSTVLYCEFVGDYITLQRCNWPALHDADKDEQVRALLLADIHMLGPFRGHFLDKLYREWHMHRAFQAAVQLHRPDIVFVLGDLFDEGDFVDNTQFEAYVWRFHRYFNTPAGTPLVSAVGNHDVGFHYKMNPVFIKRFENKFNNTGAVLYTFKEVHFVVINSMSLKGDGCHFCEKTLRDLQRIEEQLKCLRNAASCTDTDTVHKHRSYSRPIVLQHFPTYRKSDNSCLETDAPEMEKFRSDWEVLSKESTDILGKLLRPRLSFAGHSHHYCMSTNRWGRPEYTIASFNWRNKIKPSFLLASISRTASKVEKCHMLPQENIIVSYSVLVIFLLIVAIMKMYRKFLGFKLRMIYKKVLSSAQR